MVWGLDDGMVERGEVRLNLRTVSMLILARVDRTVGASGDLAVVFLFVIALVALLGTSVAE